MTNAHPEVYPSVDWITLTTGVDPDAETAYEKAKALAAERVTAGDDLQPWGAHGYRGWGTPHLRFGYKDGDTLVELSGALAEKYWREFYPLALNVPRIDSCVTVTFPNETRELAQLGWDAPRVRPGPGLRAIGKQIVRGTDGGQTLYVGSPKSRRYGRLYDKTTESRGEWPPNSWRWEVQERRDLGCTTAGRLYHADDVHRAIRSSVHGFYRYHGIHPWFDADGPSVFAPTRRASTTWDRRLSYYARCIAPGVRRGVNRGYGDAILRALGLADEEKRS